MNTNWTRLQAGLFRLLCMRAGQSLSMRGIASLLNVSPAAVSKALPLLEKEGLVRMEKSATMNLLSIGFNRDNEIAVGLKRAENLRMIYESGLYSFLFEEFPGCTIMLFGSYSRGEDVCNENACSDIDMAVIGAKEKRAELARFEKALGRRVSLNFYGSWGGIHRRLKNSILSGILLKGSVEL